MYINNTPTTSWLESDPNLPTGSLHIGCLEVLPPVLEINFLVALNNFHNTQYA